MNNDPQQPEPEQPAPKPVAYDAEGKPLYAAPPEPEQLGRASHVSTTPKDHEGHNFDPRMRVQYANEPRVVHHPRPHEPDERPISDDLKSLHESSCKKYPSLNLSDGEFVVKCISRHPIGIIMPISVTILTILILLTALIAYPIIYMNSVGEVPHIGWVALILLCLIVLVGIGGYAAVWVYRRNRFFLTNESVVQEIQHSVFSKHEQTVSLGSIEDASYMQVGIFQTMLNYGEIRLSTEGDETTYRFSYVDNPKKQIAILNNAIESFKNGRPVNAHPEDD